MDMYLTDDRPFSILHKIFNILPLPFLLLLISMTTYKWFILLVKYEHQTFLDLRQPDTKFRLNKKLKRIKIFFIIINVFFFISSISYIVVHNADYINMLIAS